MKRQKGDASELGFIRGIILAEEYSPSKWMGQTMFYKLFMNYFRWKLLRFVLEHVLSRKFATSPQLKSLSLVAFAREFLLALGKEKRRGKKRH